MINEIKLREMWQEYFDKGASEKEAKKYITKADHPDTWAFPALTGLSFNSLKMDTRLYELGLEFLEAVEEGEVAIAEDIFYTMESFIRDHDLNNYLN